LSVWDWIAAFIACRHGLAVMMTLGQEFCRIQEISALVRAGDTNVAVSPAANVPRTIGGRGNPFGN
jgi:hypothetical protein